MRAVCTGLPLRRRERFIRTFRNSTTRLAAWAVRRIKHMGGAQVPTDTAGAHHKCAVYPK
jgi:hypothetical protein